jgi:asparagine synthase (glutamine-hydrolysing)
MMLIAEKKKSLGLEIVRATESGILPVSWDAWPDRFDFDGITLFLQGWAAPEEGQANADPENCRRAIIASYLRKGTDFLISLRGSFALALWDSRLEKLLVGTDHFGTRSIYYWNESGKFGFAPRLTMLAQAKEVGRTINPNSIYFFLNHSFIPAPFTIYKEVRRLEPGHVLSWSSHQLRDQKYWDMVYENDQQMSEADAAEQLRSSLADSVRFALRGGTWRSDELGAFLSGGTDSSTLVGLLKQIGGGIKSFSVGFDEGGYNEIEYARIAAKHFNSEAHEHFVKSAEALEAVTTIGAVYEEPFGNSSAIPTFFCLQMARLAGVKIMFAGDGGDELYGGNERYITEKLFTLYQNVPRPARYVIDRFAQIIPGLYPCRKIKNYVCKANQSPIERFFAYQLYFRDHADEYLTGEFRESIDRDFPLEVPRRHYSNSGDVAALNRLLYVDLKLAISDNDLFKVNRMAEANGVQVLYPYLDPRVGMISGKIPASLKIKGWSKRYIFKKAFENFLPQEILKKKKHGFGLPIGEWLRHHLGFRDLARSLLLDRRSLQRGYFKRSAIEQLLKLHDSEASSYFATHIWNLMMLELWHRHHADRTLSRASTN